MSLLKDFEVNYITFSPLKNLIPKRFFTSFRVIINFPIKTKGQLSIFFLILELEHLFLWFLNSLPCLIRSVFSSSVKKEQLSIFSANFQLRHIKLI